MDLTPAVVRSGSGLRVLFAGQLHTSTGFWDDDRIYTATGDAHGTSWTLPMEAASNAGDNAHDTFGTGAVTLADGTPIVAFPQNGQLTWHIGTDASGDQSYTPPVGTSLYDATLVRSGSAVWAAWFAVGQTAATTGTFAMQIYPTVGAAQKAPGSSNGLHVVHPDNRVALAARAGGGVFAAYCVGYPACSSVRLWKVGATRTRTVPHSRNAARVAMSPGPSGRLWIAWSDDVQTIRAVRTNRTGTAMGAVRSAGRARGVKEVNSLTMDGTLGRGDIVANVFGSLWHTQVLAGMTLHASPRSWHRGGRHRVHFTVTDARDALPGVKVKVGASTCRTRAHGTCSITFSPSLGVGKHTARATRSGYGPATGGSACAEGLVRSRPGMADRRP